MNTFNEFVDKKKRECKRQLGVVRKLFEANRWTVADHISDDDPYLFVRAPQHNLTFDGVRIYRIADTLAYRVQREEKTHPYGRAYYLNLEEMYKDLMSDNIKEEDAGKKVIKAVVEELRDFFEKSYEAEKDLQHSKIDKDRNLSTSSVTGSDYHTRVTGHSWGSSTGR